MKAIVLRCIVVFMLFCGFAHAQKTVPADIDLFINKVMQDNKIPGLAIAIVKDDEVVFAKGYGVRTLGSPNQVNEHTLFQAASITKSFTATLLGMLVDEGKIKWNDPVKKYIPQFETSEPFVTQRLTIQDLLTFRSGLLGGDTLKGSTRNDLILKIKDLKISNSFRLNLSSYNLSYTLAGHISEIIEGKSWEEIIKDRIFVPLKMNETYLQVPVALSASTNVSTPYYIEKEKVLPTVWEDAGIWSPADAIISNVLDLAQWIKLQLQMGTFENKSIISAGTLSKMQSPQIIAPDWTKEVYNPTATFITLGLGWFISDYKGMKVIEMGGSAVGTTDLLTIIPSLKIGLIIQTNMDNAFGSLDAIKFKIIDDMILKK